MKLPTKDRYAVMAIIDLAMYSKNSQPITLQAISERQRISPTYLEKIFFHLKNKGVVTSVKGPGGGYVLARDASAITVSDVLTAMDSRSFKMTRCSKEMCLPDSAKCLTHKMWKGLGNNVFSYLNSISLEDVIVKMQ